MSPDLTEDTGSTLAERWSRGVLLIPRGVVVTFGDGSTAEAVAYPDNASGEGTAHPIACTCNRCEMLRLK
jgi:hypothetical protein